MKSFVLFFLSSYRLISRDLPESKTEVISSIGYKNMFTSGSQKNMFPLLMIIVVIVCTYSHEMGDDP